MAYKFSDKIDDYFDEYLTLMLDFPEKDTFEIKHRRRILREWLNNELIEWENTQVKESQLSMAKG